MPTHRLAQLALSLALLALVFFSVLGTASLAEFGMAASQLAAGPVTIVVACLALGVLLSSLRLKLIAADLGHEHASGAFAQDFDPLAGPLLAQESMDDLFESDGAATDTPAEDDSTATAPAEEAPTAEAPGATSPEPLAAPTEEACLRPSIVSLDGS